MEVILAKSAGFCWGVRRAVDRARELAKNSGQPVYTDGPLIHNKQMMEQLLAEGVRETDAPSDIENGQLIIRAHGIPPERRKHLESLHLCIVDATCPDVAKIQGTIKKYAAKGHAVIIFGDKGHAEVLGLEGYAGKNGFVVRDVDDVERLPDDLDRVCLVSQSTQFPTAYGKIAEAVKRRFPGALVIDTICKSTLNRQQELLDIASRVDAIVVVGGSHSANTLRLVDLAGTLRPTFHIQTADQLDPEEFRGFRTVGLTAGASTPAFIIEEIGKRLEQFGQSATTTTL